MSGHGVVYIVAFENWPHSVYTLLPIYVYIVIATIYCMLQKCGVPWI